MSNGGDGRGAQGRLIGGRYRLIERIGSGGMGTVWRALDERVEREVAVKEPRLPGGPGDESHRRAAHRLYREARAAARVDHPAAVSIHDVVVEGAGPDATTGPDGSPASPGPDGLPWIVMELVRGESLHDRLRRGPLPPAEAARIGRAVLGALRAAHAVGIVHRDVKPANVLLGPHDRVVLTDFGIAHVQGEESLTVSGEFVGSLEFVAPERMSGRGAGPASDLWSLGVLLYAAVEGWSPFRRTTLESTLAAVLSAEPPEPVNAGPLGPLIVRLLAKEPGRRPSAEEAAKGLEAAAEEWPAPEAAPVQAQRPDGMRDSTDDTGTVRLTPEDTRPEAPGPLEAPNPDTGPPDTAASADGAALPYAEVRPAADRASQERSPAVDGRPAPALRPDAPPDEPRRALDAPGQARTTSVPASPRRRALRPAALAVLGAALLVGVVSSAAFLLDAGRDGGTTTGGAGGTTPAATSSPDPSSSSSPSSSRPAPAADAWAARREEDMDAVLFLPGGYDEFARQGDAGDQPRIVVYEDPDGVLEVRLTQWDRAPRSPMAQAREAHQGWDSYLGDARTQYTRTSVQGHEAVLADTTYGQDGSPTRVMELMILTDDSRMYELRVDMPKGTPDEKRGTEVFKGARDRLRIEND
ncbi:protein kinase [Streptomyces sp. TRM S81-3]|uniref:non-specific serine/threonine protein kinase n=1 Tax=Streptomyces griseicoloratus TaxID=2752516 RepID=A0A926QUG7_9ACTN|nr:serine/threonine-protein kinase [Streptomyces griseicoloratus]MBD0423082.1 protein kinase [Streptomyces griseicoloratus]